MSYDENLEKPYYWNEDQPFSYRGGTLITPISFKDKKKDKPFTPPSLKRSVDANRHSIEDNLTTKRTQKKPFNFEEYKRLCEESEREMKRLRF